MMSWGQATLSRLALLTAGGGQHSLAVLDVVGLAIINAERGTAVGDQVLAECGRMLASNLTEARSELW